MRTSNVILISLIGALMVVGVVAYACHKADPPIDINIPGDDVTLMGTTTMEAGVREDTKLESVEFFADDQSIGKSSESPYQIKWDTTTVKDGKYELVAVGVNAEGKKIKSQGLAVTVDSSEASSAEAE